VSRQVQEQMGVSALLYKPFDMRQLEHYLRVFQMLLYTYQDTALFSRPVHLVSDDDGERERVFSVAPQEKARIVVAEDHPEVAWTIRQCLEQTNQRYRYEVKEVHDGLELLELCLNWRPHCVVTDLLMPLLNGYQVMRCLAAGRFQSLPAFVVISALTRHEVPVNRSYLRDSVVLYVDKPFEVERLLASVEQALAQ
jgi:CheY-like chemotaxis protein